MAQMWQILQVESVAVVKGKRPVPREFIIEAIERTEGGMEVVANDREGEPSLDCIHRIAERLYREHREKIAS